MASATSSSLLEASVETFFTSRQAYEDKHLSKAICTAIWSPTRALRVTGHEVIQRGIERYKVRLNSLRDAHFKPHSHQDVVELVNILRNEPQRELQHLRSDLLASDYRWLVHKTDASASYCLHFAAALWTGIQLFKDWQDAQTLEQFINQKFRADQSLTGRDFVPTATQLRRIGHLVLRPTERLDQHLELDLNSDVLLYFDYTRLLQSTRFPPNFTGIITETAQTLSLLFPEPEPSRSRRWPERWIQRQRPDIELAACDVPKQMDKYVYWRKRLETIQRVYDETKPRTLRQLWYDDRELAPWYNAWFAVVILVIFTFVFGIIQTATGIIQAVHSCR